MSFIDTIREILRNNPAGMTPQQIRDTIRISYPDFYGTESHQRNVQRGNYTNIDNALLAQIYTASGTAGDISIDRTQRPLVLSLTEADSDGGLLDESIESENLERLEAGIGTLYILGTTLFTQDGDEIVKIGITTGNVERRITQLYTTGVPFRFRIIEQHETKNFQQLEQSLHRLLDRFRLNSSREFFTEKCLPHVKDVLDIHRRIQAAP